MASPSCYRGLGNLGPEPEVHEAIAQQAEDFLAAVVVRRTRPAYARPARASAPDFLQKNLGFCLKASKNRWIA